MGSRPDRCALLFLVVLPLLLIGPALAPGRTIVATSQIAWGLPWLVSSPELPDHSTGHRDIRNTVYPLEAFALRSVRERDSPFLWNPYTLCGTRNVVNSPIRSLFFWVPALLFPLSRAHGVMVLLQLQAMGLLAYFWLRSLGRRPEGAALGAAGYGLNIGFIAWLYPEILESCLWFPFLLGCAERWWRGGRRIWLGAAGLAAGVQLLAGHPQHTLYSWGFFVLYVAWRCWETRWRGGEAARLSWCRRLAPLSMLPLGFLIAACHLLPCMLWQPEESRGVLTHMDAFELHFFATAWEHLQGLWSPDLPGPLSKWWYEVSAYTGWVVPVLGAYALLHRGATQRPSPRGFLALAVLVAVAIYDGPVSRALRHLPFLGVSVLGRGSFLIALLTCGLGAVGLDRLLEEAPERWSRRRAGWILLGMGLGTVVLQALLMLWDSTLEEALGMPSGAAGAAFRLSNPAHWRPALLAAGFLGLLEAWRRGWISRGTFAVLLLLGQGADLVTAGRPFVRPGHERNLSTVPPWVPVLSRATRESGARAGLVTFSVFTGDYLLPYEIEVPVGFSSCCSSRSRAFFERRLQPFRSPKFVSFLHPGMDPGHAAGDLGFLGVRYLVSPRELNARFPLLREVPRRDGSGPTIFLDAPGTGLRALGAEWPPGLRVFEVPGWVPRAYRVETARVVSGAEEAFAAVTDPAFHPLEVVVLEEGTGEGVASSTVPAASLLRPGAPAGHPVSLPPSPVRQAGTAAAAVPRARVLHRSNNHIEIETAGDRPGFLVLQESFDSGWHVCVGGRPARTLRADYLFRAVAVPAGRSLVTWSFWPPGLTAGLVASGVGLAAACALLLCGRRR